MYISGDVEQSGLHSCMAAVKGLACQTNYPKLLNC